MCPGIPKSDIKIGHSSLHVNKSLHGRVVSGSYIPHHIDETDSPYATLIPQDTPGREAMLFTDEVGDNLHHCMNHLIQAITSDPASPSPTTLTFNNID